MAKKNNSARKHSSPGLYFTDTVVNYATKSLGITSLGVVGETLRGRAFEPMTINDWGEYTYNFGGKSTEKYRGSQYPKYELPYIAQSYLEQSHNLKVVRVLGLSGVNAGPAWVVTAKATGTPYDNMVVLVIRSRGEHKKAAFVAPANHSQGICDPQYEYDGIHYYAKDVQLIASNTLNLDQECNPGYNVETGNFTVSSLNYGTFTIKVTLNDEAAEETDPEDRHYKNYSVTLNPSDKNYIYNVIGGEAENGDAEVYVEELYDVALKQLVNEGIITEINSTRIYYPNVNIVPAYEDVYDLLTDPLPTRDMVGRRYLYSTTNSTYINENNQSTEIKVKYSTDNGVNWSDEVEGTNGFIYTVMTTVDSETGKRSYFYGAFGTSETTGEGSEAVTTYTANEALTTFDYTTQVVNQNYKFTNCVRVVSENSFYINTTINSVEDVYPITLDFNNYKEQYRWAMSPWIVSEMKGSAENVELNKLFRFHSISDGGSATTEFKVSIENIDPETGKFDVVVRDFYDSDLSVNAYERYMSCDLVPGSPNYIALKIGSTDGLYNSKSRYITVEVIENDTTKNSIPAGFLGYPVRDYSGTAVIDSTARNATAPYFRFNTNIDDDIKPKKQYFGVSDLVGIDEDIFKYKGVEAYDGNPNGLTPCFHLDARIQTGTYDSEHKGIQIVGTDSEPKYQNVSVDGVTGYSWVTVGRNNTMPSYKIEPRIGDEATMIGTIYENKVYRKFTVAMYGGWDGWDYYRTVRSNGDEYRYKEYKGAIDSKSGYGTMFNVYSEPESLGFSAGDHVITSDYYAYLAGVKLLGNPKSITVNVLATPGIDYVNNKALVDEVIDVVEDDRGDLIYVITTPDKPSGAGDSVDEMYTAEDAVYNLEDSDIDSNHCCTYYPWVKYYDDDNNQYIYLPLTRDVVRSIAYTDNVKFSWYANAGWNRGNIPDSAQPRKKLTLPEQDTLYDGRINFVNSFAEEGNKIWGDKNLQIDDNLLNRISKRRLLLRIRTMLQNACIGLIFEPNDLTISQTVRSAVSKVLDDVKTGRGITDYKIEIDDSPETRDQLGLNVTYHIKPIQALEWINFTSVLTPEGMEWQ